MEFIRRNTDYALRCLTYMACFPKGEIFIVGSVAKEREVSPKFLHKIFQRLTRAGILISHRGVKGGFSIAKDPAKITVRKVVEVLQGPIAFNRCLNEKDTCSRVRVCSVRKNLNIIQKMFIRTLDGLTLRGLAREEKWLSHS